MAYVITYKDEISRTLFLGKEPGSKRLIMYGDVSNKRVKAFRERSEAINFLLRRYRAISKVYQGIFDIKDLTLL